MFWHLSNRADRRALPLAEKHYNRQTAGSPKFGQPASSVVLLTEPTDALWVTSAPIARYVQHAWAGAWICSLFRNQSDHLSSELITQAVAATRWWYEIHRHGAIEHLPELDKRGQQKLKVRWFDAAADRDLFVAAANGLPREMIAAPPDLGFITFVDQSKILQRRDCRHPECGGRHIAGFSYVKAGWEPVGMTKSGLHALQLRPDQMPAPQEPKPMIGAQGGLFAP